MNSFKQIKKVFKLLHSLSKKIIFYMFLHSFLGAVAPFVTIIASSVIIDRFISKALINELLSLAGVAVFANVTIILLLGFVFWKRSIQSNMIFHRLNRLMSTKVLEVDYEHVESPKTHMLREKIEMDRRTLVGVWNVFEYSETILKSIFTIVISIFVLWGLFSKTSMASDLGYAWIESPIILVGLAVIVIVSVIFTSTVGVRLMKTRFEELDKQQKGNRVSNAFSNIIHNYRTGKDIRVYRARDLISYEMSALWESIGFKALKNINKIESLDSGMRAAVTALIGGAVYIFVGLKAWIGVFGIGSVVKYAGAIQQFIGSCAALTTSIVNMSIMCDRMKNIFEFLELEDVKPRGTRHIEKRSDNAYEIEFHNVSFKYPGSEAFVLKDLSMKFHAGQRMAVVGMNGSGKTTMIKLLCRLYDPTEGKITLNGLDIKEYVYDEYLGLFSVVFQDFKLFSFSLGQNIAASVTFDENRAAQCLEKAGLLERFASMPKGLKTSLYKDFEEDGIEISGGEAQKIAIARALYKNAPFIVLDEPTAALDPVSEFEIYSKFNDIVGDKTAIYISHRLSSCRFCDDIAVFHKGRLIQRGNHETLIEDKNGKYFALWSAQAQYYNEKAI